MAWARSLVLVLLSGYCMGQTITATGPLKPSASNPHYFVNASGRVAFLVGAHTWQNNVDGWGIPDWSNCSSLPQFNWSAYLNFVYSHHYTWIRLWTWDLPKSTNEPLGSPNFDCHVPLPFPR